MTQKKILTPWLLGLTLYGATAFYNVGIIAIDDYADIIDKIIPAQNHTPSEIISSSGFRSPLPGFILHKLTSFFYSLGISSPLYQLRFTLFTFSLFNFFILTLIGMKLTRHPKNYLYLISFYFLCPLFMTRPMIETLSISFLLLSLYFAEQYNRKPKFFALFLSVLFISGAFSIRFQTAVCGLALILLPLFKKKYRHFFSTLLLATILFLLLGLVDFLLKGSFHATFFSYLDYNFHHSSSHGTSPFYTFFLLFAALCSPLFFFKYDIFDVRKYLYDNKVTLSYFIVFLVSHSLVPHKEERFVIPILPLLLILVTPFVHEIAKHKTLRKTIFVRLNWILLLVVSFSIPQKNIIYLCQYLNANKHITEVVSLNETLVLFPQAFLERTVKITKVSELPKGLNCDKAIILRKAYTKELNMDGFKQIEQFKNGFIEQVLVKLNKRNERRDTLFLYKDKRC